MRKLMSKKTVSAVIAVVTLVALLLTGTLAYVLNNQHKSAYLGRDKDGIFDLSLLNNFKSYGKDDWAKDVAVGNPIQVRSMPSTSDEAYVDAYVAVQLKEYVGTTTRGGWVQTAEGKEALFAIDEVGDYLSYAATVAAGIKDCVEYTATGGSFAIINDTQKAADQSAALGIHGKPMRENKTVFTYGNKTALDTVRSKGAQPVSSDECAATPINGWDKAAGETARDFVSFGFGDVMLLKDWMEIYAQNPRDIRLTGEFWILGDNGWAYWAQALKPDSTTKNLINNVKLEKAVTEISYYLHVDMYAASKDQMDTLVTNAQMPQSIADVLKNPPALPKWAADQGLTGTAADIGKVFNVDNHEWLVLTVNDNSDMLIIANTIPSEFRVPYVSSGSYVNYNTLVGGLKASMQTEFNSLTVLQDYAMGANTPIETPWSGLGANVMQEAALTTPNSSLPPAAFPLSISDFNKYIVSQGFDSSYRLLMMPGNSYGQAWWLRSSGPTTFTGSGAIVGSGTNAVAGYNATGSVLVRAALWVNLVG